jgi:lactam utilization protein B
MKDSITANESFDTVMAGLDELNETVLETLISDSLVEAYGNVAGFRLAECCYADEKFTVDGTIHFSSGKTRKTTYTFSEAYVNEGKISMHGLNEKLGLDKQFTLTGHTDESKTFITESFTYTKK